MEQIPPTGKRPKRSMPLGDAKNAGDTQTCGSWLACDLSNTVCQTRRLASKLGSYGGEVRLFTDTEAGKDPAQQIVGAEFAGNFTQRLLCLTQIFSQQLSGTGQGQLRTSMLE